MLFDIHIPGSSVDGDRVTSSDIDVASMSHSARHIDHEAGHSSDCALAHAAGHDRGVRCLAALTGEDADGRRHSVDVVGGRLGPDENRVDAFGGLLHGSVGIEDDDTSCCAG